MKIQINGEQRETPDGLTVEGLLKWLEMPLDRVAIERNRELISRRNWGETVVREGDRVEVVQLVGGGRPTRPSRERSIP